MGEFNVNKSDGVTSVEDALDALTDKIGLKIKYFDFTAPSGVSRYDFSNNIPSDLKRILSAVSIGGAAAVIGQISGSNIFFSANLSGNSAIRIMYEAY